MEFSPGYNFKNPYLTPIRLNLKIVAMYKIVAVLVLLFGLNAQAQYPDLPFKQATSVKFSLAEDLENAELQKLVVDYNDIVYVLTNKGLYRSYEGNLLSKDVSYRALTDRNPVDICIQEESGILFYLYNNQYLTNSYAGTVYSSLEENKFRKIAVNQHTEVLLVGEQDFEIFKNNKTYVKGELPVSNILNVAVYEGLFYIHNENLVFRFANGNWEKFHAGNNITSLAFFHDKLFVGTGSGFYTVSLRDNSLVSEREEKLPVPEISKLFFANKQLWCATPNGAFVQEPDRYRYFASKRWLDQNTCIDAATDSKGDVYLLTPTGLNKIEYLTQTLAQKAGFYQNNIRKYHMRYGFVCAPRLLEPYNRATAMIHDHDNDGLWTSFYLGSQAFRYATTGEKIAQRYCWESFEAFERLLSVNPLKGFPSRTFERKGFKVSDPDRWRDSQEQEWEWKGTTSTDEYIAYLFVAAVMDKLVVENEKERQRVAGFIDQILTHIIENDYYFVDLDGKPTLWGRWNPDYVHKYPFHVYDRKLNSLHLIAGLQLAHALTGKEIYKTEAFRMMREHGYHKNMLTPMAEMRADKIDYDGITMGDEWNHSDDEMAFLCYWPLYHYAFNDSLKSDYEWIINDHWEIEKPERNAAWNILTYGLTGKIDAESTLWHLREFKRDLISYDVKNSHRKDLEFLAPNFRGQTTRQLLTPGERTTHRHNANPFRLDGTGGGRSMLAGDEFLLPYWMCRYYGFLVGK